MMMDTAGFQKILDLSKKEEEARIAKQKTIQANEEKLLQRGLQQSEEAGKKEAQLQDQEAEMLRQVMDLSLKEMEAYREKQRHEEMQTQIALEKTKIEAANQAALEKKNEELKQLREQLE